MRALRGVFGLGQVLFRFEVRFVQIYNPFPFHLAEQIFAEKFVSFDFPVAHFVGLIELFLYKVRQVMLDFEEFPLPAAPGAAGGAGGGAAAADALGAL